MQTSEKTSSPQIEAKHLHLADRTQTGVMLLNLGGPDNLDDIAPFLYRLFSDPLIIDLPLGWLLRKPLAYLISKLRSLKVRDRYIAIGGGSPIREQTAQQAEGLSQLLDMPVAFAMRYSNPQIDSAIKLLREQSVRHCVIIPLYPQYSSVTTLSSIRDWHKHNRNQLQYSIVQQHFEHPGFIDAHAQNLCKAFADLQHTPHHSSNSPPLTKGHNTPEYTTTSRSSSKPNDNAPVSLATTKVLFVAHSVPLKITHQGDPYISQTEETVRLIAQHAKLSVPWSLAYQSRLGPVKWHGPSLSEALKDLCAQGFTRLMVHPISFVSENLETLYDLDIVFHRECVNAGITDFIRIPTPGNSPLYLKALADMVHTALQEI